MLNISNLERQHKEIREALLNIEKVVNSKSVTENINALVLNLNTLAGKLNIHMNSEDKLLYPELIKSDNEKLRTMAIQYISEMGDISIKFNEFKNKFNTKNKIINNMDVFFIEIKEILKILYNRFNKEDRYLYPQIKSI